MATLVTGLPHASHSLAVQPAGPVGGPVDRGTARLHISLPSRPPRLGSILRDVAARHGIGAHVLTSRLRTAAVCRVREEFFYRAMCETDATLAAIGRKCRRGHAGVISGVVNYCVAHGLPLPRGAEWKGRRLAKARGRSPGRTDRPAASKEMREVAS
jgi:hypothetical protein